MLQKRHRFSDYLPILLSMSICAWGPLIYKLYQKEGCDAFTMAFARVLPTSITLCLWTWPKYRRELLAELKHPWRYLILAGVWVGALIACTIGAFKSTATLSMLVTRITPLTTIFASSFLFADERRLIRKSGFLTGVALSFGGLLGLCLSRAGQSGQWRMTEGVEYLILAALLWTVYGLLVKRWTYANPAVVSATLVFTACALAMTPVLFLMGNPYWFSQAQGSSLLILLASGPLIIGIGETLFYMSVVRLGLAPSVTISLIVPFITGLYAWPVLGEQPEMKLAGFGLLLLSGLGLIVWTRERLQNRPQ